MNLKKIFATLNKESKFPEFHKTSDEFELLIKYLNQKEIERLLFEYPNFLNNEIIKQINVKQESKSFENEPSIISITLVKHENNTSNYTNLKKLKIYIDAVNDKIIKVLQN